ncbi:MULTISPECIES: GNAT family N-acetyltransferase [Alistipes]|uniref:N-acetyltransferase n=1 Tax=Alistipes hominis TaxID=2763015 RepID=A0ABR7CMZ9_9BACT|nr:MULTISPECIES: GNAT family N-acetyltransferase [Alistipes]MBC5617043.1 N-acetyltransferase [Alistipes hominis]MDO5383568.1 GNAT family N-acetyltransferase [Rikenellaceae bacterium]
MMENYKLIDNVALHQYEFRIGDLIPRIEYIKTKNGEIYLTHTEVPSALEGKGVGSSLVRLALEDIERQQLRLVPLCPFVAGYVQKHPEWKRLVMEGVNIA